MGPASMEDVVVEPCITDALDDTMEAGSPVLVSATEVLAVDVDWSIKMLLCVAEDIDCCVLLLLCVAEEVVEVVVLED